ncbi:protein kinase superfamily protein [Striga asiatica]|uniref:Protein kinase superfamily protein n=1 Tax=Striga asiatica TaxID=4170 RepID=A0A5A7NWI4_STRAF|nr:protein kinase superfamily protein [Striga asiatica]
MMVECSLSRKSKTLTEPSAETEAKTPTPPQAMSCVSTTSFSISQMVQVVSMLEVPILRGSASFQSKEVSGPENSLLRLLFRRLLSSTRRPPSWRRCAMGLRRCRSRSGDAARPTRLGSGRRLPPSFLCALIEFFAPALCISPPVAGEKEIAPEEGVP